MSYIINSRANTKFKTGSGHDEIIDISVFELSLLEVHSVIETITNDIPVDIFSILGMRNLSAFVGELFAKSLSNNSHGRYIGNPHQDGYPDLLLMDEAGRVLYEKIRNQAGLRDKSPFSPFANGGLEIKATCGAVPTPEACKKRGFDKPDMGETRVHCLTGYDWKAHHRETNNLIGIFWDFLEGKPHVMGVFFGNDLSEGDWGKIVQPKEGGGRTTSVSIMTRGGILKMYNNWIAVKNDARYINFFNKHNKNSIISLPK
jgi:hypothetical protein